MSLLNKNLKPSTRVRIVDETGHKLNGHTGTVVGFEQRQGRFGIDHFYIVLLDSTPIGTWSAQFIKESFLQKL